MPTLDKYRLQGISFIGGGVVPEDNPYLELIEEITVFGSAVTSVQFSVSPEMLKEDTLLLVSDINNVGASMQLELFFNNNLTAPNYWNQRLGYLDTSPSIGRGNSSAMAFTSGSNKSLIITDIKLTNDGYATYQANVSRDYGGSGIGLYDYYGSSTFIVTSITQLDIVANVASSIGIGSKFQLYKISEGA